MEGGMTIERLINELVMTMRREGCGLQVGVVDLTTGRLRQPAVAVDEMDETDCHDLGMPAQPGKVVIL